jgi:aerobic carbon-monoxide dehydrogenase medium subunit
MFAPAFDYYRAGSAAEAGDLLRKHPGAKLLAGGHSLIPLLKLRLAAPASLIDIGRIAELKAVTTANGVARIGALTTHAELAASSIVREHCPALAEAANLVGDPAVRNRGTIGGNVAHADPASDLPTVLTALGARFIVQTPKGLEVFDAHAFFQGMMLTALAEHDLLTAVEVPVRPNGQRQAYVKFSHPASRYAVIGVAAGLTVSAGTCTAAAVAVGGLTPRALRAPSVEKALIGQTLSAETLAQASARVADDLGGEILGDIYASAGYRKAVAPVWVKRALQAAAGRAT